MHPNRASYLHLVHTQPPPHPSFQAKGDKSSFLGKPPCLSTGILAWAPERERERELSGAFFSEQWAALMSFSLSSSNLITSFRQRSHELLYGRGNYALFSHVVKAGIWTPLWGKGLLCRPLPSSSQNKSDFLWGRGEVQRKTTPKELPKEMVLCW